MSINEILSTDDVSSLATPLQSLEIPGAKMRKVVARLYTGSKTAQTLTLVALIMIGGQACSPVRFSISGESILASQSLLTTFEDTPAQMTLLSDDLVRTFAIEGYSAQQGLKTAHGRISDFNATTGTFRYSPDADYFGSDTIAYSFTLLDGTQISATAPIDVIPVNDLPSSSTDLVQVSMNTPKDFTVQTSDVEVGSTQVLLAHGGTQLNLEHGVVRHLGTNQFRYIPSKNFRGRETLPVTLLDSNGAQVSHQVTLVISNPFLGTEPALIVRGAGCVTCHAKVNSEFITDFGFGSSYFMGGALGNPFSAPHSFYGDHGAASWLTSQVRGHIVVPRHANFGRDLSPYLPLITNEPSTSFPWVLKTNLADYILEIQRHNVISTTVTQKDAIFIGAPSAQVILDRSGAGENRVFYLKNADGSPPLSGIENKGTYFQNMASGLVCEGDLIIQGTVFLKELILRSNTGCRIYATGPIFVEGSITYQSLSSTLADLNNIQLVSAHLVAFGVGPTHCETAENNPGWYSDPRNGAQSQNPQQHRFETYKTFTRATPNEALQITEANYVLNEAAKISGMRDASCYGGPNPRLVNLSRILVNAPRVDSRYTGSFTGIIIAEVALFSLSQFSFQFDQVFKQVPVLPILQPSDYFEMR